MLFFFNSELLSLLSHVVVAALNNLYRALTIHCWNGKIKPDFSLIKLSFCYNYYY